jgi:predicted small secreted protein
MFKKISAVILVVLFFSISGCATSKGLAEGIAKDTKECGSALWDGMVKADNWIKENLW